MKKSRFAHKWATNERRAKKRQKYLQKATARGELFRPLIFETHGKISEEVDLTLLQDVNGSRAGENRHEVGSCGYFGEG